MYKLTRKCSCGKELKYSCSTSYWLATRHNAKCRNCATKSCAKRVGDCSFLLEESYQSLYWLGFLLADGHFSNNSKLRLTLASLDTEHVRKLSQLLSCNFRINKYLQPELAVMHTEVINELCTKYNIKSNKTYNPPDLSSLDGDKLLALTIGFIDGDGCIKYQHNRQDIILAVKCHASWQSTLAFMFGKSYIDKTSGYAITHIGKQVRLKEIKKFAVDNNLPILTRKWDKITL